MHLPSHLLEALFMHTPVQTKAKYPYLHFHFRDKRNNYRYGKRHRVRILQIHIFEDSLNKKQKNFK